MNAIAIAAALSLAVASAAFAQPLGGSGTLAAEPTSSAPAPAQDTGAAPDPKPTTGQCRDRQGKLIRCSPAAATDAEAVPVKKTLCRDGAYAAGKDSDGCQRHGGPGPAKTTASPPAQ